MNTDRHGLKHEELTETEFLYVDEVSTGSGNDRVLIRPTAGIAKAVTRSLPLPVLTSITSALIRG